MYSRISVVFRNRNTQLVWNADYISFNLKILSAFFETGLKSILSILKFGFYYNVKEELLACVYT